MAKILAIKTSNTLDICSTKLKEILLCVNIPILSKKATSVPGIGLNVDAPLIMVESEGLEGTLLSQNLDLVDDLVATVVPEVDVMNLFRL
jgi:hypothetical protein